VAGTEIQETLLLNGPELDLDSKRLRLAGDFTFTGGTITPNNGPLELIGATDQTLDGNFTPAANAALADLELDKSGGDLALASGTTIEVQGALDWQQPALIQTGAMSTFRFGPSATYTGAGANSYINGPAEREIFNGAEFTFPIGKNGEFRRARAFNISGVSGNEFLAAEYYTATIDGSLEDPIYDVEKNAHWRFQANAGIESRFELFWQNPVAGYDAPAHVAQTAAVGPSQNVEDMGGNEPAGSNTDGTGQVKSVQSHTFASPIYVAVGYEINPLPVELLSFEGELVEGATQLDWQTTREVNSLLFEVQRSTSPSQGFQSLGAIEAAGNSSTLQDYSYLDRDLPNAPVLYYRLKQVDLDGSAEFSKVVAVRPSNTLPNDAPLWQVGPNPTNGRNLQINGLHKEAHQTTARLISADGRVLFRSSGELPQVEARLAQRLNELPAAPYMLHLSAAGRHQHFRIVKY
jgi:hypothetical protein